MGSPEEAKQAVAVQREVEAVKQWRAFKSTLTNLGVLDDMTEFCKRRGLILERIFANDRTKHVVEARHDMMAFIKDRFGWSYVAIGELFNRDHTSVIYAVRKAKEKPVIVKVTMQGHDAALIRNETGTVMMQTGILPPLRARLGDRPVGYFQADVDGDTLEIGDQVSPQNW